MPTGYTAMLDDVDKTTAEWFIQDLIRAFGICVTLREDSMGLDEKKIRTRLEEDRERDISYHKEALKKAEKRQTINIKKSQTEWEAEAEKERAKRKRDNARRIKDAQVKTDRHNRVAKELDQIISDPATSEVTKSVAKFGIDQLIAVKSEREPYLDDVAFTWKQYRKDREESVGQDIEYHTREMKEDEERWTERFKALEDVQTDIKRLFG